MQCIEVEYIPTNSILRHPRNPKKHPEDQIHRLEASIQKFGWTSPIILSSDGYMLRYIHLIDKSCKLTVPIIGYDQIEDLGVGMYKGEKR